MFCCSRSGAGKLVTSSLLAKGVLLTKHIIKFVDGMDRASCAVYYPDPQKYNIQILTIFYVFKYSYMFKFIRIIVRESSNYKIYWSRNRSSTTLTHCAPWLTSQDDTPRSSMSTPSSVFIIPAYKKHQHRVSPSHTTQFNLSDHISLTLHILY